MARREHGPHRLAPLVALGLLGCVSAAPRVGPEGTVGALAAGVRRRDLDAVRALEAHPPAARALETPAELADRLANAPIDARARVYLVDGSVLVVRREGEAWRVDRGVLGLPVLTRPVDAVRSFHEALARARTDGIGGALDAAGRARLAGEVARWLEVTADTDALDVRVHEGEAEATAPTGEVILLRREAGAWRVVDLR